MLFEGLAVPEQEYLDNFMDHFIKQQKVSVMLSEKNVQLALSTRLKRNGILVWDGERIDRSAAKTIGELKTWLCLQNGNVEVYTGQDVDTAKNIGDKLSVRSRMEEFCCKPRGKEPVTLVLVENGKAISSPALSADVCVAANLPLLLSQNEHIKLSTTSKSGSIARSNLSTSLNEETLGSRTKPKSKRNHLPISSIISDSHEIRVRTTHSSARQRSSVSDSLIASNESSNSNSGSTHGLQSPNSLENFISARHPPLPNQPYVLPVSLQTSKSCVSSTVAVPVVCEQSSLGSILDRTSPQRFHQALKSTTAETDTLNLNIVATNRNDTSTRGVSLISGLEIDNNRSVKNCFDGETGNGDAQNGDAIHSGLQRNQTASKALGVLSSVAQDISTQNGVGHDTRKGIEPTNVTSSSLHNSNNICRDLDLRHLTNTSLTPVASVNEFKRVRKPRIVFNPTGVDVTNETGEKSNSSAQARIADDVKNEISNKNCTPPIAIRNSNRSTSKLADLKSEINIERSIDASPNKLAEHITPTDAINSVSAPPNSISVKGKRGNKNKSAVASSRNARAKTLAKKENATSAAADIGSLQGMYPVQQDQQDLTIDVANKNGETSQPISISNAEPEACGSPVPVADSTSAKANSARAVKSVINGEKLPPINMDEILSATDSALMEVDMRDILSLATFVEEFDPADRAMLYELLPDTDTSSGTSLGAIFRSNMAFASYLTHYQRLLGSGTYDPNQISRGRNKRRRMEGWSDAKERQLENAYAQRLDPQPADAETTFKWKELDEQVIGQWKNNNGATGD